MVYGVHHGGAVEPGSPSRPADVPASHSEWLALLNGLGAEGWEVVGPLETHVPHGEPRSVLQLLLKRPV